MAKGDDRSKPEQGQPQVRIGYNNEQYKRLKDCSDKKDMSEWNKWREENPGEHISLPGAPLRRFWLREVNLQDANLAYAKLQNAQLNGAHLQRAFLASALLEGADFAGAHLENAKLMDAHLKGSLFWCAELQGADFSRAIVDGETLFSENCIVDRGTKFEAVGLGSMRIYPKTKQLLEYNIRRMNWEGWYEKGRFGHWLIRIFWSISDYGTDAPRIVSVFFCLAMLFAIVYYSFGFVDCYILQVEREPGIINNLFVDQHGPIGWWLVPLRAVYFSVVTMTTLGFGDMYANPHNHWWGWFGHTLLILQVALGYVLLGALITRFAVLFTAGGPLVGLAQATEETVDSKKAKKPRKSRVKGK